MFQKEYNLFSIYTLLATFFFTWIYKNLFFTFSRTPIARGCYKLYYLNFQIQADLNRLRKELPKSIKCMDSDDRLFMVGSLVVIRREDEVPLKSVSEDHSYYSNSNTLSCLCHRTAFYTLQHYVSKFCIQHDKIFIVFKKPIIRKYQKNSINPELKLDKRIPIYREQLCWKLIDSIVWALHE